ncbi:hypothetical protein EI94DRAFT_443291 [Lactarius quietus]|nr:hypothetical protein EI94DRAFT_443291 [Lactarius quietus]
MSSDLLLESYNTASTSDLWTPLESSNSANTSFLSTDSSLQSYSVANTSFISTDSSLQSFHTANSSFISTDSSLRSFHTANSSFISTDPSLRSSYYTGNASVSSLTTISSISSHPSAYTSKSVNSYKTRNSVLYRSREHPPPVAISSQETTFVTRDPEEDRSRSQFPQILRKMAEKFATRRPAENDYRSLSWTFDSLDQDPELEQFFESIPSFCNSVEVDDPMGGFIRSNEEKLSNAMIGLMDRTLSSSLVSEATKQRRITICTKALSAADFIGPWWILVRILLGEWLNIPITFYFAQCTIAVIISSVEVEARDGRWVQLVTSQIDMSLSTLRSYLTHGDSIPLANLIQIVRKTLQIICSDIGETYSMRLMSKTRPRRHWKQYAKLTCRILCRTSSTTFASCGTSLFTLRSTTSAFMFEISLWQLSRTSGRFSSLCMKAHTIS